MLLQTEGGAKPREETAKAARGSGAGVLKFLMLLIGRLPTKYSHWNTVRTAQITLHLLLKISKGVKAKIIVEAFLVISVTPLDFSIMPRCSWSDKFVNDAHLIAEDIRWMDAICLFYMCEF